MTSPPPAPRAARAALRRAVLAASVLDDVDVDLDDAGVHLPGCAWLDWAVLEAAAAGAPGALPGEEPRRRRVHDLLLAHRAAHRRGARRVALAVAVDADVHPGRAWAAHRFTGGALDVGPAVVLTGSDGRERALPLVAATAVATGSSPALTDADLAHVDAMGELAARRLARDAGARGGGVLRPVGGCDVPTLLTSPALRAHLTAPDDGPGRAAAHGGVGLLRAVAVPARSRGWFDLARVDPAFVAAAWSATDPVERGAARPLLVSRHEVAHAPRTVRLAEVVLQQ
ncbi:hypothetical protein [Kineococcus sp. SYSU DK004]|uniref:hypothetical protein n=1 Tax=Kineococcus sp. SYSU DK004 TaxID=3383125 RepID=UPI003D7E1FE2